MPKTLGIPQPLRRPLRSLLEQPPEKRAAILKALAGPNAVTWDPEQLVPSLTAVANISASDAQRAITAVVSTYTARESLREPLDSFVERLLAAIQRFPEADRPKVEDWTAAGEFLRDALSLHTTIGVTAKSILLRAAQANTFITSQIVTDVRPVFAPDPSAAPIGAMVLHTLKLSFRAGDTEKDQREVYISMDDGDLRRLRDDIDRAFAKSASAKSFFSKDGFPILTYEPEGA